MTAKTKEPRVAKKAGVAKKTGPVWELHLYVADHTPRSMLATENLQSSCQQYLAGRHRVTIIDIGKQPAVAREHEILAMPTLIRVLPGPEKTVVGSLSDTERVPAGAGSRGSAPEDRVLTCQPWFASRPRMTGVREDMTGVREEMRLA
ncbi:MAG: circadian clock KaiB family protein [Terriglobales bacterium]